MSAYDIILDKKENSQHNKDIESYFLEGDTESITYLPNFNKINIIVGANNSGKSRFMRYLMTYEQIQGVKNLKKTENLITSYNDHVEKTNKEIDIKIENLKDNTDSKNKTLIEIHENNRLSRIEKFNDSNEIITENKKRISSLAHWVTPNVFLNQFPLFKENDFILFENIKRYYIPTLRTAHSLFQYLNTDGNGNYGKIEKDIFSETLNKYYGINMNDVKVFTGIHLYKEILNARNSKRTIRKSFEDFEEFIRKSFFGNKKIDIVAQFDKDKSTEGNYEDENIIIDIEGEKATRKLYELGDGIQAIIILMYKIFMAEPSSFIFIDEPELNLHPGMQRLFLEQICNNIDLTPKNLTYIISTHSNHFVDLTIEKKNVSIFSFSPKTTDLGEKQFTIKNVNVGDNQILKNLGVNNSSVFMANCSIWVEGISDRNYIKAFLKSYCDFKKKPFPKEDIDFAFFEYSGSNYVHYDFSGEIDLTKIKAFALNNRIFFISDLDSEKDEKHEKLHGIAKVNFKYQTTKPFREFENILPNEIWKKVLIEFRNKNSFQSDKDGKIQEKINTALALNKNKYTNYKSEYIGVFLKGLEITELNKIWKESNQIPKTFAYKTELSNLILEKVNNKTITWDDFKTNSVIIKLTEKIYDFILNK